MLLCLTRRSIIAICCQKEAKGTEGRGSRMIKVSMVMRSGTARFRVLVQAESIQRAMSIVGSRHPGDQVRVVSNFPAVR